MRIPIGYKFIIGFVVVVAAVAFSPGLVGLLGYSAEISSILGTIAGDDTLLVISREPDGGHALAQRFLALANDPRGGFGAPA